MEFLRIFLIHKIPEKMDDHRNYPLYNITGITRINWDPSTCDIMGMSTYNWNLIECSGLIKSVTTGSRIPYSRVPNKAPNRVYTATRTTLLKHWYFKQLQLTCTASHWVKCTLLEFWVPDPIWARTTPGHYIKRSIKML